MKEKLEQKFLAGSSRCDDRTPQRGVPTAQERRPVIKKNHML